MVLEIEPDLYNCQVETIIRFGMRAEGIDERCFLITPSANKKWRLCIQGRRPDIGIDCLHQFQRQIDNTNCALVCYLGCCVYGNLAEPNSFKEIELGGAICYAFSEEENLVALAGTTSLCIINQRNLFFFPHSCDPIDIKFEELESRMAVVFYLEDHRGDINKVMWRDDNWKNFEP